MLINYIQFTIVNNALLYILCVYMCIVLCVSVLLFFLPG